MSEIKLKPCRYCGKEAQMNRAYSTGKKRMIYKIGHVCPKLELILFTFGFDTEEGAAESWNGRYTDEETEE